MDNKDIIIYLQERILELYALRDKARQGTAQYRSYKFSIRELETLLDMIKEQTNETN